MMKAIHLFLAFALGFLLASKLAGEPLSWWLVSMPVWLIPAAYAMVALVVGAALALALSAVALVEFIERMRK